MQIITDRSQALTAIRTDLGAISGICLFAKTLEETRFCWPKIAPTPGAAEPCAAAKGSSSAGDLLHHAFIRTRVACRAPRETASSSSETSIIKGGQLGAMQRRP